MLARTLCLGLACLAMTSSAAAAPFLAPFSRAASAVADDGIGPPPPPLQAVNNVDRAGVVAVGLEDPTTDPYNYARAYGEAAFGYLRVRASGVSRDGLQKSASADSTFQDTLTIAGAGVPGATYHFAGSFIVAGATTYLASTGLSAIDVLATWDAYQDAGATHLGGDLHQFERNSTGLGFAGIDFLGSVIPVEFDFVWGSPVILEVTLGADIGANSESSGTGSFASASVLMGDSLTWLGASISTTAGAPVEATIRGASGTDWSSPAAVPEPMAVTLLALGLAAWSRQRQGASGRRPYLGLRVRT